MGYKLQVKRIAGKWFISKFYTKNKKEISDVLQFSSFEEVLEEIKKCKEEFSTGRIQ